MKSTISAGGPPPLATYAYDLGGRRTSKAATGSGTIARTETYGYDAIDQVTSSNYGTAGAESFAYDPMGNRTAATLLGQGSVSYTANNLNQYTSVSGAAPTYDANGNTLTLPDRTFAYDGQSRLTSAATASHAASFVYDARNRQVSRTVDGVTTFFIWDNWSLLAEYQLSGGSPVQVARYVHGPRLDEILVQARGVSPTPVYLQEDALGSTYLVTDAAGAVVERYTYTAYGEVSAFDNTGAIVATPTTRFLYTGREWIGEVGLNDHRNRFYLPSVGRWPSRDPIKEKGGLNMYAMMANNLINYTDPAGLFVADSGTIATTTFVTSVTVAPSVITAPAWVGVTATLGIVATSGYGYWQLGDLLGDVLNPVINRRQWTCQAKCQARPTCPGAICPDWIYGTGTGSTRQAADDAARSDATNSAPQGCYGRHCRSHSCWQG